MAYSISITKRTNGGFTIVTETDTFYASNIIYYGTTTGVILYTRALTTNLYTPSEWTIQEVSGFTTIVQICDALDNLGIAAADSVEDIKALLTTVDADTGNISSNTNVEKGAGLPTLKTQRVVQAKPDYVDITSDTVIYEGYSNGTNYDICKIDLSTSVITRLWAVGTWANRASLFT